MQKKKAKGLLEIASEQIPFGIYAIEKNGCVEMRRDRPNSKTALKELRRQFRFQGYKVYANGI